MLAMMATIATVTITSMSEYPRRPRSRPAYAPEALRSAAGMDVDRGHLGGSSATGAVQYQLYPIAQMQLRQLAQDRALQLNRVAHAVDDHGARFDGGDGAGENNGWAAAEGRRHMQRHGEGAGRADERSEEHTS